MSLKSLTNFQWNANGARVHQIQPLYKNSALDELIQCKKQPFTLINSLIHDKSLIELQDITAFP